MADPRPRFDPATVRQVLDLVRAGPPRLAAGPDDLSDHQGPPAYGGRLLCVDGPAGSGKTTLAAQVADLVPGAVVLHLDDLLAGWEGGLPRMVSELVGDVLAPLSAGRVAARRHHDWHAGRFVARRPVPPSPLLVVEGVAAGSRLTTPYRAALVWVEAAGDVRRARGIARDGDAFAPHWESWARREAVHFARESTRRRADLVLST